MSAPARIQFTPAELALLAHLLNVYVREQDASARLHAEGTLMKSCAEQNIVLAKCALARVRAA